ncbi:lipase family protein [Glutamicibacter ardleyensis]|uniref:lipase family protein n=1 Tax=Glutamicibacter ardleyensis TaxID=225894 RepID=UPI003FD6ACF7
MALPGRTSHVLRFFGGLLLVAIGLILMFNAASAVRLLIWLLSAGLFVAGLLRLSEARDKTARRIPVLISGALLALSGIALPLWRGASLPAVALAVSAVLFLGGALRFIAVLRGHRRPAFRGALTALTGIFGAVLALFWPRLSLWVLGVGFAAWLILLGARGMWHVLREKLPEMPRWLRVAKSAGLTAVSVVGLVAVLGLGAATAYLHSQSDAVAAEDFYLPPATVPSEHGQLVRAEPLSEATLPGTRAWRILYTTQAADGSPALASGLVTIPAQASGTLPVPSWANGTKGVISKCALSLGENPYDDGPAVAREQMLADGWAIVATDYVGLGTAGPHPYLIPAAEAFAVLDATLAASQLAALAEHGVELGSSSVIWGHSQGGHAALAAADTASSYAPQLQILGVAAMAPATDLPQLAEAVADTAAGKIVTSYIAESWNQLYPGLGIEDRLTNRSRAAVAQLSQNCFTSAGALAGMAQASQLFEPIFSPVALDSELHAVLLRNSSVAPLDLPVFLAQGAEDTLVLPSMQRGFVEASCKLGAQIGYLEYPGREHMPLVGEDSALNADLVAFTRALAEGRTSYPDGSASCHD